MLIVSQRLAATCRGLPERRAWLDRLPDVVRQLQDRWTLTLGSGGGLRAGPARGG